MITRNNYELYIIDFYDGKLNKIQVEELHLFLNQNPDLKEEFEFFADATLDAEPIIFKDKANLKKVDSQSTEHLIAYYENDLSASERNLVEEKLKKDVALANELEIIKKTKQLPDYTILFENKSSLKQSAKVIAFSRTFYRNLSIAASVILIAIAYFIFRPDHKNEKMMADDKKGIQLPVETPTQENVINKVPIADQKSTTPSNKVIKSEKLQKVKSYTSPQNEPTAQNYEEKVSTPEKDVIPQNEKSQNNLANDSKNGNGTTNPVLATEQKSQTEKPELKVTDLSEIFTEAELAELGLKPGEQPKKAEPNTILDYAADKLKHFSDSKDISLDMKDNLANDATTFAVNVGKNFSVSHTRSK